jgi:hypothetical protein
MAGALINRVIQVVAGVAGGNVTGTGPKNHSLGTFGNTSPVLLPAADKFSD